ncbi:MAG: hypothetical protein IJP24_04995 [Firmicutes bacterium]|nr:hypothetical protein [Bacillota bacterium]
MRNNLLRSEKRIRETITALRIVTALILIFMGFVTAHIVTCMRCGGEGVVCGKISLVTYADRYRDDEGKTESVHSFDKLENGDILVTDSVHTAGWRHGHVAVVIDKDEGLILEAVTFGVPTKIRNVERWESYANVAQLRIKDDVARQVLNANQLARAEGLSDSEILGLYISEFARENIHELDYGFIPSMKEKAPAINELTKTHCAHLVWYLYMTFGLDLDSDGGFVVTPDDILNSEKLEIVETFGISQV